MRSKPMRTGDYGNLIARFQSPRASEHCGFWDVVDQHMERKPISEQRLLVDYRDSTTYPAMHVCDTFS
jgi:hypothetical protein